MLGDAAVGMFTRRGITTMTQILTIDGTAASGKGTLAKRLAQTLNYAHLDTGMLWRVMAMASRGNEQDITALLQILEQTDIGFERGEILVNNYAISSIEHLLRTEEMGQMASRIAVHLDLRTSMQTKIRSLATTNIVIEGRDAGTVLFPDAHFKVFLFSTDEAAAYRRSLTEKTDYQIILASVQERNRREITRTVAPLRPAPDAYILDTTNLTPDEVWKAIFTQYRDRENWLRYQNS